MKNLLIAIALAITFAAGMWTGVALNDVFAVPGRGVMDGAY